jgi:hypothetical protein
VFQHDNHLRSRRSFSRVRQSRVRQSALRDFAEKVLWLALVARSSHSPSSMTEEGRDMKLKRLCVEFSQAEKLSLEQEKL